MIDFTSEKFDVSLRKYLTKFWLPGEAQKIDRIMQVFAKKYCIDNPTVFPNSDTAYVLAYSAIMLNTDRHNPAVSEKDKMTKEQFVKNNRDMWNGEDPPREFLDELYDSIAGNEILLKRKGDPDKKGWNKSINALPYKVGKHWFCLVGNELRWYKNPTLGQGDEKLLGKILLDYVMVKEEGESFAITSALPKKIEFKIYNDKGKESIVETIKFEILCENVQLMEGWAQAVRENVTFKVVPEYDPQQKPIKAPKGNNHVIKNKKKF